MCIYMYTGGDNMKKTTQRIVEQFPNLKEKVVGEEGKLVIVDDAYNRQFSGMYLFKISFVF